MLIWDHTLLILVAALAFDAVIGDPDWLWRRLAHPVVLIGGLIGWLDRALNRAHWSQRRRKLAGVGAVLILVVTAALVGILLQVSLQRAPGGDLALGLVAATLIAQRSLYQHVAKVRDAFVAGGLDAARAAVAMIVGRDPKRLDAAGVSRAAIESCAENFSDGVVAPVLWLALFGLPGLIVYKAINTADSMIGHRTPRYESFGWAAARLDDLVNLVPARLAGLLIALIAPLAHGSIATSLATMRRDAAKHRSPNAGWPESAMAGALGIALAGPRIYAEGLVDDPLLNAEARIDATPDDIGRALNVMLGACVVQAAAYAALALVL
ncbi:MULTISPECIES: adenosylcobinamide-phosphate synthase CbiB [Rhodopseudomonas]|uniref:Cobalamin biosynthesis protein CobD n=1 Tax=Rhodopseudomonas palustris TaxID=1076 RepID=A0A0D7E5M0_RHOPL|nr:MULTISPECIES: adenosylcobinamide-phosphate synthase CbiB [Rhodopseudomonas]KIZ36168.1 cobalamin biosynthesis protein CobD [Rhodopseudomonas palustris]MDF3812155.1 adenosylcobinamide-phosphate synthase CbiB [Rhodopseudomonas sp. BAL398]WOK16545.1 adenosylcobinamide-phosphate synthase CbiB [Rhodopseudomonas sp. BAL398]